RMREEGEGCGGIRFRNKEGGFRLGGWVNKQRHNQTLSEARRQQLDELGFVWDPHETDWAEGFRYLTIYKQREGHCRVPVEHMENGFRLGQWARVQRRNADTLSAIRRQQLDELGFVWDPLETDWVEGLRYLTIYKQREGHCRVPRNHMENGFRLGQWVGRQRQSKQQETLPEARRQQLDELGLILDPHEAEWEEGLCHLITYKKREGHCRVPGSHMENGFRLGAWVARGSHNQTLAKARRQQLDELGLIWDPHEADWEKGVRHLITYKEREGHCRVPQAHKENGYGVGKWVNRQRQSKQQETLLEARRQQLDELGFVWDPHEADWEE